MARIGLLIWLLLVWYISGCSSRSSIALRRLLRRDVQDATKQSKDGFLVSDNATASQSDRGDDAAPVLSMGASGVISRAYCATALWKMTIRMPNCFTERHKIPTCLGMCTSFETHGKNGQMSKSCKCCQEIGKSVRHIGVRLRCLVPKTRLERYIRVTIPKVMRCRCRPCLSS